MYVPLVFTAVNSSGPSVQPKAAYQVFCQWQIAVVVEELHALTNVWLSVGVISILL